MHKRWDRIGAMNAARDRRAATGGKTYKQGRISTRRMYRPQPKKGTWEYLMGRVEAGWRYESQEAIERYRRVAFPDQYPEIEEFF
jgi:hypothetical protein